MSISRSPEQPSWALITGASAGIGEAFAKELAARGFNLILTARRRDRLANLAIALKNRHGIECESFACDLSAPESPQILYSQIKSLGISIDMLINNAGYGVPGAFHTQTWQTHADFIQVLMTAPAQLCHLLLPDMQKRGYGRIINVASLAGHLPGSAGHTMYAASKAFLITFSQSLALENRRLGIHVCALCPGFTYSEFHDVTGTRALVSKMPKWMWMTADAVVRQGLKAVEDGKIVYVNGRINRLIKALSECLPDALTLKVLDKRSKDFRIKE